MESKEIEAFGGLQRERCKISLCDGAKFCTGPIKFFCTSEMTEMIMNYG